MLKYWQDEKEYPKWFRDANETWHQSDEEFLEFCNKCRIYEFGGCALYVEPFGDRANLHFSVIRGSEVDTSELFRIKTELLKEFKLIFGWILRQNRGVQKIAKELGMNYHGVQMFHGSSHGKVLEWWCFSLARTESFIVPDVRNLLSLAN